MLEPAVGPVIVAESRQGSQVTAAELMRTPIFVPERHWEMVGQVPNVVFVEGLAIAGTGIAKIIALAATRPQSIVVPPISPAIVSP